MDNDDPWRRRFFIYSAVRVAGLAIFLLGLAIAYSDLVRVGGWPRLGVIIAILGVVDTVLAPRLLKKGWDRQDRQHPGQ
jgi:hypothetical protein